MSHHDDHIVQNPGLEFSAQLYQITRDQTLCDGNDSDTTVNALGSHSSSLISWRILLYSNKILGDNKRAFPEASQPPGAFSLSQYIA